MHARSMLVAALVLCAGCRDWDAAYQKAIAADGGAGGGSAGGGSAGGGSAGGGSAGGGSAGGGSAGGGSAGGGSAGGGAAGGGASSGGGGSGGGAAGGGSAGGGSGPMCPGVACFLGSIDAGDDMDVVIRTLDGGAVAFGTLIVGGPAGAETIIGRPLADGGFSMVSADLDVGAVYGAAGTGIDNFFIVDNYDIAHCTGTSGASCDPLERTCGHDAGGEWSSATTISADEAYFGGAGGRVCRWTRADGYRPANQGGLEGQVNGLWKHPAGPVLIAMSRNQSRNGALYDLDGGVWLDLDAGFTTVHGVDAVTWFVGDVNGRVHQHLADGGYRSLRASTQAIQTLYAVSATDVFAGGNGGNIVHFDGTTWTSLRGEPGFEFDGKEIIYGILAGPNDLHLAGYWDDFNNGIQGGFWRRYYRGPKP